MKVTWKPYFITLTINHFKVLDVQTSEMDGKLAPVDMGQLNFLCRQIFKRRTTFNENFFVKNRTCERGGRFKVKIYVLFHGNNS
jgi:hypothetical protein